MNNSYKIFTDAVQKPSATKSYFHQLNETAQNRFVQNSEPIPSKSNLNAFKDSLTKSNSERLQLLVPRNKDTNSTRFVLNEPTALPQKRPSDSSDQINSKTSKLFAVELTKNIASALPLLVASDQKNADEKSFIAPRIFTGTIEKILRIHKFSDKLLYLYETFGKILRIANGKWTCEKILHLRQSTGPVLQGVYYEIDFKMPEFELGTLVRIVGRFVSDNRFQIFKITEATAGQQESAQRLEVLSEFIFNRDKDKKRL